MALPPVDPYIGKHLPHIGEFRVAVSMPKFGDYPIGVRLSKMDDFADGVELPKIGKQISGQNLRVDPPAMARGQRAQSHPEKGHLVDVMA